MDAIDHAMERGARRRSRKALAKLKGKDGHYPSSKISASKARKILEDGSVRGHKLTPAQRGMFGAAAGRGR